MGKQALLGQFTKASYYRDRFAGLSMQPGRK